MDESDSDSDSGSEDDQSVTEEEQLRIAAAAAAAAAVEKRDILQLTSLLARKDELPLRTRNKFDELVFELLTKTKEDISADADAAAVEKRELQLTSLLAQKNELPLRTRNTSNELVAFLLFETKNDIHEMICHNNSRDDDDRGLDSSRDTEAQVETAIRFFPEVISECDEDGQLPIQRLCIGNVKAVSFIALLARLAIEFHSFEDHERGGLLIENDGDGDNIFNSLMYQFGSLCPDHNDLLLTLFIRLRRMGLFKKDDIRRYDLVSSSCFQTDSAERGRRFLVEWDPISLLHTDEGYGWSPLHWAAEYSIRGFQIAFGYGIRYYPFQKGLRLLFQKDNKGDTPFQVACRRYGRDNVMEIVEETLTRNHSEGTPLNIVEALMVAAAGCGCGCGCGYENAHLDCSYFLLRREPDVLVRLLSGPHNNNHNNNNGGGDGDGDGNHNDVDDDEDHEEDNDNNNRDGVGSDGDGGDDDNGEEGGAGTRKRKR